MGIAPSGVGESRRREHQFPATPPDLSEAKGWWTRTQRIRTAGEVVLGVALLETEPRPLYQRVARKALHLRELGLSYRAIARRLELDDKTVAKAIGWLRGMRS